MLFLNAYYSMPYVPYTVISMYLIYFTCDVEHICLNNNKSNKDLSTMGSLFFYLIELLKPLYFYRKQKETLMFTNQPVRVNNSIIRFPFFSLFPFDS